VTWRPRQQKCTRAETAVQQTYRLHRKADPSLVEDKKERMDILVMDPEETEVRIDCAHEGQQQLN
jgi:hypothetical protein